VAKICKSTLDPVPAPRREFPRAIQRASPLTAADARLSGAAGCSPTLPGGEFPMLTKKGVGCRNRGDFLERLADQCLSLDGQAAPLIITEDASVAKLLLQPLVFSPQALDDILLTAVNPTRDHEEEQVPGLSISPRMPCETIEHPRPAVACQGSGTEIASVMATAVGSVTCRSADFFGLPGKKPRAAGPGELFQAKQALAKD